MSWIQRNFKTIIYISFLVPILLVAIVSISHVTSWYGLSNPFTWAIYLSVGIEVAALSALAAISAQMGKKVYVPFGIVTLIQFIGNIFFAYQFIDVNTEQFKDWVDLVDPVVSYLGVESGNIVGHKRFLALFSGGMLPIISLSFLHMLVKFEEEEKNKEVKSSNISEEERYQLSTLAGIESAKNLEEAIKPSEEDLKLLEEHLKRINEKKFGSLTDSPEIDEEQKDVEILEVKQEIPLENLELETQEFIESTLNTQQDEKVEEVSPLDNEVENSSRELESDTQITVEPDFYKEEEPQYSIDEVVDGSSKRLSYFRSH